MVRPGYMQTEVGVIPEDWRIVALEDVAVSGGLVRGPFGGALKKEFFVKNGYKVYEQKNAIYGSAELGGYSIDSKKYRELERFRVEPGDFIVSCSGTIGSIYRVPANAPEGIINQALLKMSLNPNEIEPRYFLAVFRSGPFQDRIKESSHGGAMHNLVGMETFRKTPLQLPPTKAEQEAIAGVLSDADALIESLENLIAKKRQIKQGAMQELLTGKTRLPGFESTPGYKQTEVGVIPEDWRAALLDTIASVTSGKRLPLGESLVAEETPHPYIRVVDMRPGTVSLSDIKFVPTHVFPKIKQYRIYEDDIFISVAGTLGIVGRIPTRLSGANLTENADRITDITCSQEYLLHALMSGPIQRNIGSIRTVGAQPKLALGKIRKFVIPLPPTKAEQEAIAAILSDMDAEITALKTKLVKARQIKQSEKNHSLSHCGS
jgi:type I restriction enzyme S subunit